MDKFIKLRIHGSLLGLNWHHISSSRLIFKGDTRSKRIIWHIFYFTYRGLREDIKDIDIFGIRLKTLLYSLLHIWSSTIIPQPCWIFRGLQDISLISSQTKAKTLNLLAPLSSLQASFSHHSFFFCLQLSCQFSSWTFCWEWNSRCTNQQPCHNYLDVQEDA